VDWLMIVLRLVHIFAGVAWAGAAALFFFFIEPTINKLGPDAEAFVDEVVNKRKLPLYMLSVATLTIVGGVLMYWHDTSFNLDTMGEPKYLVFGLGGLSAFIAWLIGGTILTPAIQRVGQIGGEIKAAGGPPSAELMARMRAAQERVRTIGLIDLVLVGVAVLGMATARYVG
jgi:uncharacterized membrane protein